jgi:hypothetical protein
VFKFTILQASQIYNFTSLVNLQLYKLYKLTILQALLAQPQSKCLLLLFAQDVSEAVFIAKFLDNFFLPLKN